ncbi:MAG: O-antigen ligase family protein [Nostocaceae cyanobacterium]|nr:O-antigen ligase family protein [Nostocaceae cyanobacterium]
MPFTFLPLPSSRHPDPSLQLPWNCAQWGLLFFPLSPLLGAIGVALALLLTWWRKYRTIIRRPLNWGFALLGILMCLSIPFAYKPSDALLGIFNFLPFFIAFAAFSTLIQTTSQLRQIAWILVLPSPIIVILGLGQLFFGWQFHLQWVVIDWAIAPGGNPPGRMASIFMYANTLAGYLVMVFILALGLWIGHYTDLTDAQSNPSVYPRSKSVSSVVFLSLTVIGSFVALILTNSRNAWGIAIIAGLAYALYLGWRWLVAIVMGVAASILAAAFAPKPVNLLFRTVIPAFFWARLTDEMYPDRPVALMRSTQWNFAWLMTLQRPWFGWGLRNFTPMYENKMNIWLGHPHCLFLMLSMEIGIPATLLFCGLAGWVFVQAVRVFKELNHDKTIVFTYLVLFLCFGLFNTVDVSIFDLRVNLFSWVLFSAICGLVYRYRAGVSEG